MLFATAPLAIVDAPADEYHRGGTRPMQRVKCIIIHHTGGTNSLPWLTTQSPLSNPVSCHRLIAKDGTIYKIVPDDVDAWHAGRGHLGPKIGPDVTQINLNRCSLGLELENRGTGSDPYPQPQIAAAVAQCVEWLGAYGPLMILGHSEVDGRKRDPKGIDMDWFRLRVWQVALAEATRAEIPL